MCVCVYMCMCLWWEVGRWMSGMWTKRRCGCLPVRLPLLSGFGANVRDPDDFILYSRLDGA